MASANGYSLFVLALVGCFSVCVGGDFCTTSSSSWPSYSYDTTYCVYGCCGYYPNEYCCSISVGVIVGGVFGTIAGICALVALICCCVRASRPVQRGTVVTTQPWAMQNTTGVSVVSTANTTNQYPAYAYGQQMPAQPTQPTQPVQPPPYTGPAPPYGYANPAYPPATTSDPYTNGGYKP